MLEIWDVQRVEALLQRVDAVAAMRRLFSALAAGGVSQPPQVLTELVGVGAGSDFITYPAALAEPPVFGAKLSPYLPESAGEKVTSWTLLMSSSDGRPLLLCDAMALTVERTAATTALAVDLLAPTEPGVLVVIGSGAIGLAHLRLVAGLRPWKEIRCWSPSARSRVDAIQDKVPAVTVAVAASMEAAVRDAQVILLCTSSATPVLDPRNLPRCALVTSIATNAPGAHEIPPESLLELDVYCDFARTTPATATEMQLALDFGWSTEQLAGDLPALVTGRARMPTRTAYFRSVGLGCEDLAMAAALYERA